MGAWFRVGAIPRLPEIDVSSKKKFSNDYVIQVTISNLIWKLSLMQSNKSNNCFILFKEIEYKANLL